MDPNPKTPPLDLVALLPDLGDTISDQGYAYVVTEVRISRRVDSVSGSFKAVRVAP